MSNTVLSFMDLFWIWFVVAIASGGTTYLILTEEIRNLKRDIGRTS
jgi:hypothetical protein